MGKLCENKGLSPIQARPVPQKQEVMSHHMREVVKRCEEKIKKLKTGKT